jgi:hypothetical protein
MEMTEFFGLRKIAPLVRSYAPPESDFDPQGEWSHQYRMFQLAFMRFVPFGKFSIQRSRSKANTFQLDMLMERSALSGFNHFTAVKMVCANNALSTPLRWSYDVKTARNIKASPYRRTGMSKSAVYKNKAIRYQAGDFNSTVPVPKPFACKTALFDAVQRMSTKARPLSFDFMDEYDELSADHTLHYKGTYDIQLKTGVEPLSCFIETGSGTLPISYWRDASGRLLFRISGVEVFVLTEADGDLITYDDKLDLARRAQKETEKAS